MTTHVRIRGASVEVPPALPLGAYAPETGTAAQALQALVARAANEASPDAVAPSGEAAPELELRTTFARVEPDTAEHPFAHVQLVIEVRRRATGQLVYTRKAEVETRRLLQPPVPVDDPRFERTALGRAILSSLRSAWNGLLETFDTV